MPGRLRDVGQIRGALADKLSEARRDGALFAVLTVLLTPAFLAGAAFGVMLALHYIRYDRYGRSSAGRLDPAYAYLVLLMALFIGFFARPPRRRTFSDFGWVCAALAVFALMGVLAFARPAALAAPALFWTVYAILTLLMLAFLGHVYEPREDYSELSMGSWVGPFDVQGQMERRYAAASLGLGCAVALPRLIFGSYSEIFGSLWLLRGLDDDEVDTAAAALHALGEGKPDRARQLLKGSPPAARALFKLRLVSSQDDRVALTGDGEKLVGASEWL